MVEIKNALRGAEGKASLDGIRIDAGLKAMLERHGTSLRQAITRAYDTTWPADPIPVDPSVTGGPNGAYTSGPPIHITVSSTDSSLQGLRSLEMLFHESSHSPQSVADALSALVISFR